MEMSLKPELQAFVDEQLRSGRFTSMEAVVQEALERMMAEEAIPFDEETLDALDEAEDQIERGEWRELEDVAAELRAKYPPK